MQVSTLINHTHFLFIIADNLNKVTHYIGKEGHSTKHDDNCNDPLVVADWIVVTITDCTQSCEGVIATDDQLVGLVFLVQFVLFYERIGLCVVIDGAEHEPDAADEIGDDDGDDDESKDLVDIQHHVLGHNLFIPRLVTHQRL